MYKYVLLELLHACHIEGDATAHGLLGVLQWWQS